MLSKELCLDRLKELSEAQRMHGMKLYSEQLLSLYNMRFQELYDSINALSQDDRVWLELQVNYHTREILKLIEQTND